MRYIRGSPYFEAKKWIGSYCSCWPKHEVKKLNGINWSEDIGNIFLANVVRPLEKQEEECIFALVRYLKEMQAIELRRIPNE